MHLTMRDFYSETLPYLEHHKSAGHLLVVSLHKQLIRTICNAAVLILITIAMGDTNGLTACETATREVLLTSLTNRLKLLIHNRYCSFHAAQH